MSTDSAIDNVVVYDGDCGICEWSASWIRRNVPDVNVVSHIEYGLSHLSSVWFVSRQGRREGALAVAAILQLSHRRLVRLVGTVIQLPLIRTVAAVVYALIARNRRRLSRLFRLRACAVPQR